MNTLHNERSQQDSSVFLTEQSTTQQISLDLQCKQIPTNNGKTSAINYMQHK